VVRTRPCEPLTSATRSLLTTWRRRCETLRCPTVAIARVRDHVPAEVRDGGEVPRLVEGVADRVGRRPAVARTEG